MLRSTVPLPALLQTASAGSLRPHRLLRTALLLGALIGLGLAFSARAGAYVYWANSAFNGGPPGIGRANLDATGANQNFIINTSGSCGVAVDGTYVYWGNSGTKTIGRANLDGTNINQSFIATGTGICGVAVDAAHIYWATGAHGTTVGRANLDGTGVDPNFITGADPGQDVCGVAVDGNYVYWAGGTSGNVGRAPLSTRVAEPSFITVGIPHPCGVAINATSIFWGNTNGTVGRANLDGSGADETFVTGTGSNVCGVAVDAGHVYWSNSTAGGPPPRTIGRANLDGSSPENNFIIGTSGSCGVAVDALPLPSNNFTIVPRITCAGICHVILVKISFDSAGMVIAEQALPNQPLAGGALTAKKKKSKPLIKKLTRAVSAGTNTLKLKLTAAALKTLKAKGKLKIKVLFTFTPTGGTAKSQVQTFTVKLPRKKHGRGPSSHRIAPPG